MWVILKIVLWKYVNKWSLNFVWAFLDVLQEMDEIKPYPVEVLPGFLYLGNWFHGNESYIQKDLKIKAHINVCVEPGTL